ncbi:hypothetical protein HTH_1031 [Hydrogenobacter thermophilus TK-6]|uniref:Uncharacterized protein n=1 Tax=Hydrogenobacter thermophilus (strain DSM 6534 / IAM 12695 / TK-6) TaxID=608538 RepID=D3DI37_HYDTT|nr:hypothetical protein HTH_1031 [Hydrogenobacter thermophilus TK-6]
MSYLPNACLIFFLLTDKKLKLRVDGMLFEIAKIKRARVKRIKRFIGKKGNYKKRRY